MRWQMFTTLMWNSFQDVGKWRTLCCAPNLHSVIYQLYHTKKWEKVKIRGEKLNESSSHKVTWQKHKMYITAWKKPVWRDCLLYDSSCDTLEKAEPGRQNRWVLARAWGGGGVSKRSTEDRHCGEALYWCTKMDMSLSICSESQRTHTPRTDPN